MSVLDRNGLGDWLAERLVAIGDTIKDDVPVRIDVKHDPFLDERLRVTNLPLEPQNVTVKNPISGAEKQVSITLFRKPGETAGARRGISEFIKWMNYVTENRFFTHCRRPLRIHQRGTRQFVGTLRSGHESARDSPESGDPGSRQRFDRDRDG